MKRKILVIKNELSILMMLANFLSDEYDVIGVENGYEAISWIQNGNHADLLLIDTDMAMINSYEFEQSIKKQKGMLEVPLIMFSTTAKDAGRNNNMAEHSINLQKIRTKINAALGRAAA